MENIVNERQTNERRADTTFVRTMYKQKLLGYKNIRYRSTKGYDDTGATVIEDEEGIKLQLKHTHHLTGLLQYSDGNHNYW